MAEHDQSGFPREIFDELDHKLRHSDWQGGAPEAHGLLTGLACRGITAPQLQNRLFLFNSDEASLRTLLQGLFELVLRDLGSTTPTFDLLLPDDGQPVAHRSDELAGWCSGFIQGYLHDGEQALSAGSAEAREIIRDIVDISGMVHGLSGDAEEDTEAERSLVEIEEYLRAGVQFVYDEQVADLRGDAQPPAETH